MTLSLPVKCVYEVGSHGYAKRSVTYTPTAALTLRQFSFIGSRIKPFDYGSDITTTIHWSIYLANELHLPTGTALKSGSIPFTYASVWKIYRPIKYTVVLPSALELSAGIEYCFVFNLTNSVSDGEYSLAMAADSTPETGVYSSVYTTSWQPGTNSYNLYLEVLDAQAGTDWHVVIDGIGYMTPDMLRSYRCDQVSSGLAQTRGGQSEYSQLRYPYSNLSQDSWTSGSGQLSISDLNAFLHSKSIDTTVPEQMILGPAPKRGGISTNAPGYDTMDRGAVAFPLGNHSIFAQKFTAPVGGITVDTIGIRIGKTGVNDGSGVTISICEDDGGEPSGSPITAFVNITNSIGEQVEWVYCTFSTGVELSGETDYWIRIDCSPPAGLERTATYKISFDKEGSYSGGVAKKYATEWEDMSRSLLFRINNGQEGSFNGNVVKFAYGNVNSAAGFYCAAGKEVYKWNETNEQWDALTAGLAATATDLICFNDKLFVGCGYSNNAKSYNGTTWSDAGDAYKYFHIGKGYLWATTGRNTLQHSNDGTTWSSDVTVGEDIWEITGLINYGGRLLIGKEDGIWEVDDQDLALEYLLFREHAAEHNCRGWSVWNGMLFIPVQGTIWRWQGSQYKEVGPTDQRSGPTNDWPNEVSSMVSTPNLLFAASSPVTDTGRGGLMAYNGMGWHHLTTHTLDNQSSLAVYVTTEVGNEYRIWYSEGARTNYITMPEHTNNRYDWDSATFESDGVFLSSWWDGGLKDALKFWNRLTFLADIPKDTYIDVYYAKDGEDWEDTSDFVYMGRLDEQSLADNGEYVLMFPDGMTAKMLQLIFYLQSSDSTKTPRIKAYNIESVVRQQPVYAHSFRILLADNITKMNGELVTNRTAQDMWEELQRLARTDYPLTISFPFKSIRGMVTSLSETTYRFSTEDMDEIKWERVADISVVEAT